MGTYSKFYFRPAKGEHIHTIVEPETNESASICGKVVDSRGRPRSGALVLLFKPQEGETPTAVSRFITDDDGEFLFGPLAGETLYLIKVYCNSEKVRELEIRTE